MNSRRGGGNNRNNSGFFRQAPKTNFVSGGQQTPSNQVPSRQQTTPAQQVPKPGTPVSAKSQPLIVPKTEPAPSPAKSAIENLKVETLCPEKEPVKKDVEMTAETEKKSWMKKDKLPKKERIRRRNQRLSKLLQPKTALMILNELVQNLVFEVSPAEGQFLAVVTVAEVQHTGLGKNKIAAKNAAAENALQHLIRTKKIGALEDVSENGSEKMDTDEANENFEESPLPLQQVASFALYKLFDSLQKQVPIPKKEEPKKRSAKKLPENPSSVNPISMVNQMFPQASFEEVESRGTPPSITFKVHCNIDGQIFEGIGPSKKAARKEASYAACHKLLGIVYPPEEYKPPQ